MEFATENMKNLASVWSFTQKKPWSRHNFFTLWIPSISVIGQALLWIKFSLLLLLSYGTLLAQRSWLEWSLDELIAFESAEVENWAEMGAWHTFFGWLNLGQNAILKTTKIMCFLEVFHSQISIKSKKNHQIFKQASSR
jgi:hypothetical protein